MATSNKDINYIGKDFNQFRENLINFAKIYYKNTFNDFNENDPGMMFIDMSSYVGDVLSYYSDYNLTQTLLNHTSERAIILDIAQSYGYKPKPAYPARTKIDVYQIIPSLVINGTTTPNWDYALQIKPGMEITANDGSNSTFRTLDILNFAQSGSNNPTNITVYKINNNTGLADYYLLQKSVDVEAGTQKTTTYDLTAPQSYITITLPDTNIISIDSVTDSDGNNWYETAYLAQDYIFYEVPNTNLINTSLSNLQASVPYLLKILKTSKRFITRYLSDNRIQLRFGSGFNVLPDEVLTPNPDNIGMPTLAGSSKLNVTWDPANFIYTKSYGQTPSNTTLTVKYTIGGGIQTNIASDTLTNISKIEYYNTSLSVDPTTLNACKKSIACKNPIRATGGRGQETIDEIRDNALAFYASQDRIVNMQDFISRVYSMPAKFGSISKAYITQDEQLSFYDYSTKIKNPFGLNLYVLSLNANNQLVQTNDAIKENLKTYLSKFKILTDSINIKDAFVINIAISFQITTRPDYIANEVLLRAIDAVKQYFDITKWQINQPISKYDVIQLLANVTGVQSVIGIKFYNTFDPSKGYIPNIYDLDTATRDNIIYPSLDPSIFSVQFSSQDIYGKILSY